MADKKKSHRFRLTKQSRTASMGDMLLSIFTDKPKVAAVEKEYVARAHWGSEGWGREARRGLLQWTESAAIG